MASVETIIRQGRVAYRGIPWDATNRKKGPTKVFDTESAAMAYARGWETDQDRIAEAFGAGPTRNRKRVLLSDYAMTFAVRANGTPNTKRDRRVHARILGRRWAGLHVDEVDRGVVNELLFEMERDGAAPGTQRKRLTFLRTLFAEAVLDKLIEEDPCRSVVTPKRVTIREHRPPTEGELAALIEHFDEWFEPAILLANDSGLRASEVCGLRWFRIDWDNARVTVKDVIEKDGSVRPYPKGKETRVVPLSPRTLNALRRARLRQRSSDDMDFVVQRPNGSNMTAGRLSNYWKRHCARTPGVGDPRPTFHDLRHGCAHRLVASGVDIHVLQEFMGHKSLATTEIYMPRVTADQLTAALAAVPVPAEADVIALSRAQ